MVIAAVQRADCESLSKQTHLEKILLNEFEILDLPEYRGDSAVDKGPTAVICGSPDPNPTPEKMSTPTPTPDSGVKLSGARSTELAQMALYRVKWAPINTLFCQMRLLL
jgi:hypothetical protein